MGTGWGFRAVESRRGARSFQQIEGCRNDWEKVDCRGLMLAPENEAGNLES